VKCKPGELILDFCGGSGGKSLAVAHLLENKGQIFLNNSLSKYYAKKINIFCKSAFEK